MPIIQLMFMTTAQLAYPGDGMVRFWNGCIPKIIVVHLVVSIL